MRGTCGHCTLYTVALARLSGVNKSPRVVSLIDTVYLACLQNQVSLDKVFLDTNETTDMIFRGKTGTPDLGMKICKPRTTFYSYKHDRCLIGMDHAGLLGFTADAEIARRTEAGCAAVTDHQARMLFGNSVALPQVALVFLAALVARGGIFE